MLKLISCETTLIGIYIYIVIYGYLQHCFHEKISSQNCAYGHDTKCLTLKGKLRTPVIHLFLGVVILVSP